MGWGERGDSPFTKEIRTKTHEQPPVSQSRCKDGNKKRSVKICKYNFIFFLYVESKIGKEDLNCLKRG
jgi:hypothetical protein